MPHKVKIVFESFPFNFIDVPTVTATVQASVKVGNSVTITCTIQSNPSATSVTWQKYENNQPTTISINSGRYTGGTLSVPSLTINSVVQDDQGQYVCQATNSIGTGSSNQVYLTISGGKTMGSDIEI